MNDTKLMMSDRVAASTKLPSRAGTAARTVPRPSKSSKPLPKKISASIHNLPGANFIMTSEILRTNVCRICATYYESGPNLVPLYVSFAGTKLSEMINVFLPIKVQEQDGLPEYACRTCTNKLMAWRDMRDSVAESARILLLQAKILAGIPIVEPRRNVSNTLHFVDLMDSSDEDDPDPHPRSGPRPGPDPHLRPDPGVGAVLLPLSDGEEAGDGIAWRYVLGSWAI